MVDNVAEEPANLTEYRLQKQVPRYLAAISLSLLADILAAGESKYVDPKGLRAQVVRFRNLLSQNRVMGKVTASTPAEFGQPKQEEGITVIPIGTPLVEEFLSREQMKKKSPTTPPVSEKSLDEFCRLVPAVLALNPNGPTPIRPTPTIA